MTRLVPSDQEFQNIQGRVMVDVPATLLPASAMREKLAALGIAADSALGRHALSGGALFDGAGNHYRLATDANVAAANGTPRAAAPDIGDIVANLICGPDPKAANTTSAEPSATPGPTPTGPRRLSCEEAVLSWSALPLTRAAVADAVADRVEQMVFGRILESQVAR